METKLKLSDIIRYILLGVLAISLGVVILYQRGVIAESHLDFIVDNEKLIDSFSLILIAGFVGLCYLAGIIINACLSFLLSTYLNLSYSSSQTWFTKAVSKILYVLVYRGTVSDTCYYFQKRCGKPNFTATDIPSWLLLPRFPDKLLFILAEKVLSKQENDCEYLYLNEFILGLRFLVVIAGVDHLFRGLSQIEFSYLAWLVVIWLVLSMLAKNYAIKYVKYIGVCVDAADNKDIDVQKMLPNFEIPCAYILIRSTFDRNEVFFEKMLNSVVAQDYPNIKVILLEDENKSRPATISEDTDITIQRIVGNKFEVIHLIKECGSAAAASIFIREHFIDEALDEDFAIFLDDDDYFSGNDSVSRIVNKMTETNANMCLLGFTTYKDMRLNLVADDTKLLYNKLLDELSPKGVAEPADKIADKCMAASMGWTKCYKKSIIVEYIDVINSLANGRDRFEQLKSYEDFPDFITLLFKQTRVTAISKSMYIYRQHLASITSNLEVDCFKVKRIGFLKLLSEYVECENNKPRFIDKADVQCQEFIKYKLSVISSMLTNNAQCKALGYVPVQFMKDYNAAAIDGYKFNIEQADDFFKSLKKKYRIL